MPSMILGTGDVAVNKRDKNLYTCATFLGGRQAINKKKRKYTVG